MLDKILHQTRQTNLSFNKLEPTTYIVLLLSAEVRLSKHMLPWMILAGDQAMRVAGVSEFDAVAV